MSDDGVELKKKNTVLTVSIENWKDSNWKDSLQSIKIKKQFI